MLKKIFFALLAVGLWQSNLQSQTVTDTIDYPAVNATNFIIIGEANGGYFFGTNSYVTHIGQYFAWAGQATVKGVIVWCGKKQQVGTADTYSILVYNAGSNNLPTGSALATKTFTTAQMDTGRFLSDATTFLFATPPTVTDQFVIAIEVAGTGKNDTLGFIVNDEGDGLNLGRSLLKWNAANGGNWDKFLSLGDDRDIIIMPIIEYQAGGCIMSLTSSNVVNNTNCVSPNGSFRINVSNGTAPYQFNNSNGTNNSTGIFSGLSGGTYAVTVTDAASCTATRSVTITDQSGSSLNLSVSNIIHITSCAFSNPDFTITWGGGTPSYTFTLTGPVSGQLNAISLSGSYSYNLISSTIVGLPDLVGGSYTLTLTDAAGCTKSVSFTINDLTNYSVSVSGIQANTLCGTIKNGQATVAVAGGQPPFNYYFSSGQSGSFSSSQYTLTNLGSGTYSVTVNDQNSCSKIANFTITDNAPIITVSLISVSGNSSCIGPFNGSFQASASGGTPPYTFSAAGLASNSTGIFSNLASGSYNLIVTDANGCSGSQAVSISNLSGSNLTVSVNNIIPNSSCTQPDGGFTLNISGGTAPYTIINSGTAAQTQVFASGSFSNTQLGITGWGADYGFTIHDNNNCSVVVSFTVPENAPIPHLSLISITSNTSCNSPYTGGTIVSANGGSGNYEFTANGSNYNSTGIFSQMDGGTYLIQVEDNFSYCSDTLSVQIPDLDNFDIVVNVTNASSSSSNDGSASASVTGGTPPYSFYWDGYYPSGSTYENLFPDDYYVQVQDASGCSEYVSFTVGVGVGIEDNVPVVSVFNLFPNPGSEKIYYEIHLKQTTEVRLELMNVIGQKISDKSFDGNREINGYFDVSDLSPGFYFAKVIAGNESVVRRVIVQ